MDSLRKAISAFMQRPVTRKLIIGKDINCPKHLKTMKSRFHKLKAWADAHPQCKDKTWDSNFDESKHKDGIYYHFTRCPPEKFARENGFPEALPIACEIDYLTLAAWHGVLHRDYTPATGGGICNYWIVPDQIKDLK